MKATKVVGLTGGIATGKSTVSNYLKKLGAVIIDADLVAREVVKPGERALKEIVELFGLDYLKEDNTLDRVKLGDLVFSHKEALLKLNSITHPIIVQRIKDEIEKIKKGEKKPSLLVVDAPLLIETNLHKIVDQVWLVKCTREEQIKRLMKRNNLDYMVALARINAQTMSLEEKANYAHEIIDNSNSREETKKQVNLLWVSIVH